MRDCAEVCNCEQPRPSSIAYGCAYGPCWGTKCDACGKWPSEQPEGHCCYPYNSGQCPKCQEHAARIMDDYYAEEVFKATEPTGYTNLF